MSTLPFPINRSSAERIGRTIRSLRVERRMTGVELAERAGTSQSRVSKIENGYPESIDAAQVGVLLDILNSPKTEAQAEVGKTVKRQDALWDRSKRWHIVMPEQALYTAPADSLIQIAQLDRLERVIGLRNIRAGIIPLQAGTSFFETGSFSFYDDKVLYVRMGDRTVRFDDPDTLVKFLSAFDELSNLASFDEEAIRLARKAADYFAD